MAAPNRAKPFGRKPVDQQTPTATDPGRQSRGPSGATGRAPRPKSPPPGGDPRQSRHGGHLQGNTDKGGPSSYK
jgi:hypothetical protein